jgi:hypothetical protein
MRRVWGESALVVYFWVSRLQHVNGAIWRAVVSGDDDSFDVPDSISDMDRQYR